MTQKSAGFFFFFIPLPVVLCRLVQFTLSVKCSLAGRKPADSRVGITSGSTPQLWKEFSIRAPWNHVTAPSFRNVTALLLVNKNPGVISSRHLDAFLRRSTQSQLGCPKGCHKGQTFVYILFSVSGPAHVTPRWCLPLPSPKLLASSSRPWLAAAQPGGCSVPEPRLAKSAVSVFTSSSD